MERKVDFVIEPAIFDVRNLLQKEGDPVPSEPVQEFILEPDHPILPESPDDLETFTWENGNFIYKSMIKLNAPQIITLKMTSLELNDFSWRQIPIPVAIWVLFSKDAASVKGLSMNFADRSGQKSIAVVPVNPELWMFSWPLEGPYTDDEATLYQAYNKQSSYQIDIRTDEERAFGGVDYWNMTYFVALPKCSMNYDFWITARGTDSAHKPFDIEFYVDGQKITQDNFAEMAEKYPALKENKPDPWPLPSLF